MYNDADMPRLCSLYDFTKTKYRALQAMGVDEETYSAILVPMLLEKIPDSIRLNHKRETVFGVDIEGHVGSVFG